MVQAKLILVKNKNVVRMSCWARLHCSQQPLISELPLNQRRERVTISYNDIDLLADFGGFMGLYIGASLLQTSLDAVVLAQHVIEKIKACI